VAISNARTGYINGTTSGWVARSLFSVGDNLYAVVLNTSASLIEVHKSTDGGVTWTEQDSSDSLSHSNAAHSYDANVPYTSNGYIYVAYRTATNTVRVRRFDTSTDTWESTDIGSADASTTAHSDFGIALAVRSDGDVILVYRNSSNNDLYHRIYEGSSWAAQVAIHTSNTSIPLSIVMTDNSDMAHVFFYEETASDFTQRSIDSSNTLGTVGDLDSSVSTTRLLSSFGGYVNDGGTHRISIIQKDSGGEADFLFTTSGSAPSWSITTNLSPTTSTDPGILIGTSVPFQNRWHAIWSGNGRGYIHADRSDDFATPAFGTDRDVIFGLANDPACYAVATPTGIPVLYTDHTTPSVDLVWAVGSAPSPTIELSEGVASANTSAATTLAVAKPSGLADDDVAYITVHLSTGTISAVPSGFTELASDLTQIGCRLYLYRKVITNAAGEPATWDFTTSSTTSSGISWWARGADLTTPEDTAVTIATSGTDSGGTTITGVTTTMDDTVLITASCFNATGTTLYGPTQSADIKRITEASYRRQIVTFESRPSAGATGNRSAINSTSGAPSANFAFAIRPAAGNVDATGTVSSSAVAVTGGSVTGTAGQGATGTVSVSGITVTGGTVTGTDVSPVDATGTVVNTTYTNHMPNPSAETGVDWWGDGDLFLESGNPEFTITQGASWAESGSNSVHCVAENPFSADFALAFGLSGVFTNDFGFILIGFDGSNGPIPAAATDVVTARVMLNASADLVGKKATLGDLLNLDWATASTLVLGENELTYTWTATAEVALPVVAVEVDATEEFDLDAAYIAINEPLPPGNYGDGDSPGWAWSGTPHASTSSIEIAPAVLIVGETVSATAGQSAVGTVSGSAVTVSGASVTGTTGQSDTGTVSAQSIPITGASVTGTAGQADSGTVSASAVVITGGTVDGTAGASIPATGEVAAQSIPITGGSVTATTGQGATGSVNAQAVTITGNTVTATAGQSAIGAVLASTIAVSGASIAGSAGATGLVTTSALVVIGGQVVALAGSGDTGTVSGSAVTITGGVVTAIVLNPSPVTGGPARTKPFLYAVATSHDLLTAAPLTKSLLSATPTLHDLLESEPVTLPLLHTVPHLVGN